MRTWPGQRGPHFSLPWTGLGVGPKTPFPSTPQLPSLILNTRWERGGDSGRWKERDSKKRNREGGSGWGIHVNPWLIHFNV